MSEEEVIPHGNDILMGRGGKNNQHTGNEQLRNICRGQRESYRLSSKKGKSHISREIVAYVRSMDPPGRFLKKDALTGDWEDVGDDTAREKVSQVLRDAVSAIHSSPSSSSSSPSLSTTRRASSNDAVSSNAARASLRSELSTPPASAPPATSRYGRRYTSSRRASSSDDARLHMIRSGNGRSYSPSQVTSIESSYHPSPDRQLHRSSAHHQHHQPYPQESHRTSNSSHQIGYQHRQPAYQDQRYHPYSRRSNLQGQYPRHDHHQDRRYQQQYEQYSAYDPNYAFEHPQQPRQRHHSAPSAVGSASAASHADISHSPIHASDAKKQRRQEEYRSQEYAYSQPYYHRAVPSYQHAAHAASHPGEWPSAAAAAAHPGPSPEEDFDLFAGGLLDDFDRPVKTDRSAYTSSRSAPAPAPAPEPAPTPPTKQKMSKSDIKYEYGGLSSSTF